MATASWSSSTLVQSQISGFSGGLRQSRSHPKFSHLYKEHSVAPLPVFLMRPVLFFSSETKSIFILIRSVVESASAIVFLKEHGVVYHELPQLRSVTSMELGCDARGYSHAGNETAIWIQETLSIVDKDQPSSLAAIALKEKRLTFTWLDGEAQQGIKKHCHAPYSRAVSS
ncbi:hypothetical protein LOK49_LG14G00642 [Camellia lanceoleosa]|uniref:Uncharacterized protein n=1 Tax=Camellia lanceoleosa TaxID=1840588 RepID=A0ACC0FAL8_9ERIC|nr:hypothetical protein LOK49_LG14G00642 [Camellia lanceoleosa]